MELDEKQEYVRGNLYRYSTEWIHGLESERHWRHYWFQQKIMERLVSSGDNVLEIGVGTGFTTNYLKSKGVKVTTLDIDVEKNPDIHNNVVTYDFEQAFDHILAFEVFEHIPFEEVEKIMIKLASSCKKYLFISVPRNEQVWLRLEIWLPLLKQKVIHFATRRMRIAVPYHYWEIDAKGISRKKFNRFLSKAGFKLIKQQKFWSFIYSVFKVK